jgi:hypothetical protein
MMINPVEAKQKNSIGIKTSVRISINETLSIFAAIIEL